MMFSVLLSLALAVTTVVALPTTIDAPIPGRYAKTYLPDCAIEGSFVENPTSKHYGPQAVHDIIACQTQCHYTGGCVMYSWDVNAKANACYLYAANGSMNVASTVFTDTVARGGSGIFFADRHVRDGTEVCYMTTPLPRPVDIARLPVGGLAQ
ncbi:hypothetical protein HYALB_00010907 [Hymenoscyphus albidus]|uniref:Apple domain-containing protein n=1 Tax=Hymenoscyphus albidus TaxID=595503 RepID=A0A9N9LJ01_9HELO|nr:hypothetical protein HYALB_00010907 [Hymenoscyphus albidus]